VLRTVYCVFVLCTVYLCCVLCIMCCVLCIVYCVLCCVLCIVYLYCVLCICVVYCAFHCTHRFTTIYNTIVHITCHFTSTLSTVVFLKYKILKLAPWSRVLLEKSKGPHLIEKFPAIYVTRKFITAFAIARHTSLS
jgi:hypothetical protein